MPHTMPPDYIINQLQGLVNRVLILLFEAPQEWAPDLQTL